VKDIEPHSDLGSYITYSSKGHRQWKHGSESMFDLLERPVYLFEIMLQKKFTLILIVEDPILNMTKY